MYSFPIPSRDHLLLVAILALLLPLLPAQTKISSNIMIKKSLGGRNKSFPSISGAQEIRHIYPFLTGPRICNNNQPCIIYLIC